MTVRRLDNFSSAIVLGRIHHFQPGTSELAFFGVDEDTGGRVAVLDGQLVGRERHASAAGLVVVRESYSGQAYFDRVPLECTLPTEEGGRAMWLSDHRQEMPAGILRVSAGHAALTTTVESTPRTIGIEPVDPSTTLSAFGLGEAYANAEPAAAAETAAAEAGTLATVHQLHPAAA